MKIVFESSDVDDSIPYYRRFAMNEKRKKFWKTIQWVLIYGACVVVMFALAFGGSAMMIAR